MFSNNTGGMMTAEKHGAQGQAAVHAFGPGGVAAGPREPNVFNAMIMPQTGLLNHLPLFPSMRGAINVGIVTGVTETTNSDGSTPVNEADDCCDDFPEAGLLKMCEWSSPWGLFGRQSRVLSLCDFDDNYCDMPQNVIGGADFNSLAPQPFNVGENNALGSTSQKALFELATAFARDFAPIAYTGDPANNTAGGGYREYWGLERIINTGYQDAITLQPCPAADPLVLDFPTEAGVASPQDDPTVLVTLVRELVQRSWQIASDSGLGDMVGTFIGPRWMFDCFVRLWACGYMMDCGNQQGTAIWSTSLDWTQLRDQMLQQHFLLIDGMPIQWIVDDSQSYTRNVDGTNTGTLYYTPMSVLGGRWPVFYQQYYPWDNRRIREAISQFGVSDFFQVVQSPRGGFLLFKKAPRNLCLQIAAVTKRRLVHHAPYLAWRLDNITCGRMVNFRHWQPGHPDYVNGGRTETPVDPIPPINQP